MKATSKRVVKATPKRGVKATPKRGVKATPKRVVRATPKRVVRATPKRVVRATPKRGVKATPKRVAPKRTVAPKRLVAPKRRASVAPRVVAAVRAAHMFVPAGVIEQSGTRLYLMPRTPSEAGAEPARKGPRIIPVRADALASSSRVDVSVRRIELGGVAQRSVGAAPPFEVSNGVVRRLESPPFAAPRPTAPGAGRALSTGVTVGRVRPGEPSGVVPAELAQLALTRLAPPPLTSPPQRERAPFVHARWAEIEDAARRLGIPPLCSDQRRTVRALLEGRDVLAALASGTSMSDCTAIVASLSPEPCVVVVSRLASLRARSAALGRVGLPALAVEPALRGSERAQVMGRIARGGPLLVLATPDSLHGIDLQRALAASGIALCAVEEAHTLSAFSDELRPASARLATVLDRLGRPPVYAHSATAPTAVRHDIATVLGLRSPVVLESRPHAEGVVLDVVSARGEVRQRALVQLVMRLRRPGVVVCGSAREVDAVHAALGALRVPVQRCHAELPSSTRALELEAFLSPVRRCVLVTTSAGVPASSVAGLAAGGVPAGYGDGALRADARFVVHYQPPVSLEQYVRDLAGLAADGEAATAVMFHDPSDRGAAQARLASARPKTAQLREIVASLEAQAEHGGAVTIESVALAAGLSRATTEAWAAVLDDAGVVAQAGGWLRVSASPREIGERCRQLAHDLGAVERLDARRLDAVAEYAAARGCRSLALGRHFGVEHGPDCGRCSGCTGEAEVRTHSSEFGDAQRAPARHFGVSYHAGGVAPREAPRASQPLTAKLADFGR